MKKILAYVLVNIFTWNPNKSLEIVREFLNDNPPTSKKNNSSNRKIQVDSKSKNLDKKNELLHNLEYLKSKSFKTKKDKESIYTLEMILKNM